MSDDAVTLDSLAASVARVEEVLAAEITLRAAERAADKKERQEERAADKKEIGEKLAAFINELKGIKDMMNKAEEEKAKAKKEREDAEARMWQGLKDGLYATFLSQFTWTHKGGGFCNDTRMKAE
jgi:hypothetical protein